MVILQIYEVILILNQCLIKIPKLGNQIQKKIISKLNIEILFGEIKDFLIKKDLNLLPIWLLIYILNILIEENYLKNNEIN